MNKFFRNCKKMIKFFSLPVLFAFMSLFCYGQSAKGIDQYDFDMRVIYQAQRTPNFVELQPTQNSFISVDIGTKLRRNDPMMIGYNIEDINHAFFPGLYAQMLWNESFEEEPNQPLPDGWKWHAEPINTDTPADDYNLRRWRGAWAFENGAVYMAGCRQRRIWTDLFRSNDAIIEVETLQSSLDRTEFWGPNLLFCWGDDEFFSLQISYERKIIELRRGKNKNAINMADCVAAQKCDELMFDKWTKIKAEIKKEGSVIIFINGKKTLDYKGEPIKEGGLGIDATFTNAWFRNLKAISSDGKKFIADFNHITKAPYNHENNISKWWNPVEQGTVKGEFKWSSDNPYNTNRCQMMSFKSGKGRFGLSNSGLRDWGLTVRKDWKYKGRIYLRGNYKGNIIVALQSQNGDKNYAEQHLSSIGKEWKRFDFELTSSAYDSTARFAVMMDNPGTVFVDQVILLPDERGLYKGLPLRKDLVEKLTAGMSHIRFGGDMINQKGFANWKNMLLEPDKRRQYLDGWSYHKSAQFMIFEFLEMCKAANVEPIPNFDNVPAEEVADFVEYCNGSEKTVWGKKRIESGRKEPYGIKYLMIGNGMPSPQEIREIVDLVKKIDPSVEIIVGDVGHTSYYMDLHRGNREFDQFTGKQIAALSSRPAVHLLSDAAGWECAIDKFRKLFPNAISNGVKLYAEEVNGGTHNMQRGLCDALFTMISERNGDVVSWQSFCTALHASENLYEWDEGHIFFNSTRSWYQPAGWIVKLLGENYRTNLVQSNVKTFKIGLDMGKEHGCGDKIDFDALTVTATMSDDNRELILKVVNIYPGEVRTDILIPNAYIDALESITVSSLHLNGVNTAKDPDYIKPELDLITEPANNMLYTFKPMSFTILKYKLQ